jgi:hypothetical protein
MSKRSPKKRRTLPALGLASVSLSMASGACATIGETNANTPQMHEIFLGEEEISDVSLATFYVFDKENVKPLQLARGGCGGGGGCGHGGGCHGGGGGCGCHGCGGCHAGCAGGCHVGCAAGCAHMGGCHMGGCHGCGGCHGRRFFFGGCVGGCGGCGGCGDGCGGDTCYVWTPSGWVYSCWSNASPAASEG